MTLPSDDAKREIKLPRAIMDAKGILKPAQEAEFPPAPSDQEREAEVRLVYSGKKRHSEQHATEIVPALLRIIDEARAKSEGLRVILGTARAQLVAWMLDTLTASHAVEQVAYIDKALSASPSPTPQQDAVREVVEAAKELIAVTNAGGWCRKPVNAPADRLKRAVARLSHPIPERGDGC